ncbi:MAG: hypothetical protein JSV82_03255 [Planctomycetota bacterium]|nr:MAG: hypothetical protein JSV82_03255 [Planctomycetota bacterium]
MAITFHCEYCHKKIEAPNSASGRWGKCPACHKKVYVPGLDAGEELKLAPIDESDIERQKRLIAETRKIEKEILSQKEIPDESGEAGGGKSKSVRNDKELREDIANYLRQMADGELDYAERIAKSIVPKGKKALKILDEIAVSEIPEPGLGDIPQQVLSGLIRALRGKIK